MRALHFIASVALCVVASSCASPGTRLSVPADYQLDPNGKTGIVVGSITYDTGLGIYSVRWTPSTGGGRFYAGGVGYSMWPPLGPEYDADLKAKGGTFAVEVPAGEYTLQRWSQRAGYIVYSSERPIGLTFTVQPGQVTYLGNFHFHKSDEVSLEDRASRDIPILKARYASVRAADVGMSIADGFSLQAIGGEVQRKMDFPAYRSIVIPVKR